MSVVDHLDAEQQRAVMLDAPAICVLAGAGSGKTRVLTRRVVRRIEDGSADAEHTLVLTFTRKAAQELRDRLAVLDNGNAVTAGTFHAVAYSQLRQYFVDRGKSMPAISTQPSRLLQPVLQNLKLDRSVNPRLVASEIAWSKNHGLGPEDYEKGLRRFNHRPPMSSALLRKIYEGYEWQKRRSHVLDYEDLLLYLRRLLKNDSAFAAVQRWRFRHFFVDEFQDLNHSQFDLLRSWMAREDGGSDVFFVGDVNQSIYGWNGADSELLRNIQKHFQGVEVLELRTNYRSTSSVLAAARTIIDVDQELVDGVELGARPSVREYENGRAEAEGIARDVRAARFANRSWNEIAILVRTNAQRPVIEEELTRHGIPFKSQGAASWMSIPAVQDAVRILRESPSALLSLHVADLDETAMESADADYPYLQELAKAARECMKESPAVTNADFLAWIPVAYRNDAFATRESNKPAVSVMTFHKAKGLEWPVVFLAGLENGLVPLGSMQGEQLEEERRLFYVAVTRAREELHCSWAHQREGSRGLTQQTVSPWLAGIAALVVDEEEDELSPIDQISVARSQLHVENDTHDRAREALVRWRAARVKLTGLSAASILPDSVIDLVVERQPHTVDELADIEGIGKIRAASVGEQLLQCLGQTPSGGGSS